MSTVIFWFRSDLRLHDQPALAAALHTAGAGAQGGNVAHLLPVVCQPPPDATTP